MPWIFHFQECFTFDWTVLYLDDSRVSFRACRPIINYIVACGFGSMMIRRQSLQLILSIRAQYPIFRIQLLWPKSFIIISYKNNASSQICFLFFLANESHSKYTSLLSITVPCDAVVYNEMQCIRNIINACTFYWPMKVEGHLTFLHQLDLNPRSLFIKPRE